MRSTTKQCWQSRLVGIGRLFLLTWLCWLWKERSCLHQQGLKHLYPGTNVLREHWDGLSASFAHPDERERPCSSAALTPVLWLPRLLHKSCWCRWPFRGETRGRGASPLFLGRWQSPSSPGPTPAQVRVWQLPSTFDHVSEIMFPSQLLFPRAYSPRICQPTRFALAREQGQRTGFPWEVIPGWTDFTLHNRSC